MKKQGESKVVADGHTFGPLLFCSCGHDWSTHQSNPKPCPQPRMALAYEDARQKAQVGRHLRKSGRL